MIDVKYQNALKFFNLKSNFTQPELKKAYFQLAKKYHSDVGGSDKQMIALNNAYEILKTQTNLIKNKEQWTFLGLTKNEYYANDLLNEILDFKIIKDTKNKTYMYQPIFKK